MTYVDADSDQSNECPALLPPETLPAYSRRISARPGPIVVSRVLLGAILMLSFVDPGTAQSVWRPFSADSPWNQRIPRDAKTDPQSAALIEDLAKGDFVINMDDWSIPVYYVKADSVPKVNVINSRPGIYGKGFAEPNHIPVLPDFIASPPVGESSDNHMCILDTAAMLEWDMWAARKNSRGDWTTGLGAVTDLRSSGVERPWFDQEHEFDAHRSRAGGFPLIAGLIMPEEIAAGRIEHALVFAYQRGRSEFFIPPASTAQATFMEMNNRFGIPMGGRIQLDPSIDVDTLPLTPACKVIAKALQEYGAFNGDYAGATVLYADNSPSALRRWKGVLQKNDLLALFTPAFVKAHFRVIALGNLLPGQNLEHGDIGFVEFGFPGATHVSIDWIARTVECVADRSVRRSQVIPYFRTVRKSSVVTSNHIRQESGATAVDLRSPVVYTVEVPRHGTATWTVSITPSER